MSRKVYATDLVRSPALWFELAEIQALQSTHLQEIGEAIERNDFDGMKAALTTLVKLVKSRQPVLNRLSPALTELMAEVFEGEG